MPRNWRRPGGPLAADPPRWATGSLGEVPLGGHERRAWIQAAESVAAYRQSHGVSDEDDALGPCPGDHRALRAWELARLGIDQQQRARERHIYEGMER